MPTNSVEGDTLVRRYETGNEYRIRITSSGFMEATTPWGVTKISLQALDELDGDITGVIQYPAIEEED